MNTGRERRGRWRRGRHAGGAPEKNAEFAKSLDASFPILSDPDAVAAKRYGVLGLTRLFAKRWTFYIDREGVIRSIEKDVDAAQHGEQVVRTLSELGFPRRE